jgi:ribosome-binding factor A
MMPGFIWADCDLCGGVGSVAFDNCQACMGEGGRWLPDNPAGANDMTIKQERIQELIRTHLSDLLLTTVTDPALQGVTVTDVVVNREIEHSDIYVHALGDDSREQAVMQGLERASGFLRSNLASRLRIRQMPVLHFHWDHTLAAADHIDSLLDSVKDDWQDDESESAE